jgi:hypothetical protein
MNKILPDNTFKEIKGIASDLFGSDGLQLTDLFFWKIIDLFNGKYDGFQACDTPYHDLDHSLEVTLTLAKIISGWNRARSPAVSNDSFDLGILAAMLHDVGYIKKAGDDKGTGAKYTFSHVCKSVGFANRLMEEADIKEGRSSAIRNIIWLTCTQIDKEKIKYAGEEEMRIANSLGTADLVGQMSSPYYLEKLPHLYVEFEEAYQYEGLEKLRKNKNKIFESADQLIKGTPEFYYGWVIPALSSMGNMYQYIAYHYPDNVNHEIEQLEENMKMINDGLI